MNCKKIFVVTGMAPLLLGISNTSVGQEKATPQEVKSLRGANVGGRLPFSSQVPRGLEVNHGDPAA